MTYVAVFYNEEQSIWNTPSKRSPEPEFSVYHKSRFEDIAHIVAQMFRLAPCFLIRKGINPFITFQNNLTPDHSNVQ